MVVRRDDFRIARFAERAEATTIFAVDASGSAAVARLAEAKGAVELLLAEAYVARTQVALVAFRGTVAEVVLPPTRSLARAKRALAGLAGGGGTPLAAGLDVAAAVARVERGRGRSPFVVVLTDGRANIAARRDRLAEPGGRRRARRRAGARCRPRRRRVHRHVGAAAARGSGARRGDGRALRPAAGGRCRGDGGRRPRAGSPRGADEGGAVTPPPSWRADGSDWPNREHSRFVAAGGVRWHVQVAGPAAAGPAAGAAPVILLLHGTGAATHSWRDILPALADRFTVVAPDLPGHGFSSALTSPTLPAMAAAVAALTAELGLRPALIVGHSAGAAIALRLSLTTPTPVVAINGALLPFPGMAAAVFPALAKLLFVNPVVPALFALQARMPGTVDRLLASTGSTLDARGAALYARLFRRPDHVAGALAMMANWDLAALAADLPKLTAPLNLIYGERDKTVPPQVSRDVAARVAGANVELMGPLGHLAHEEAPDAALRIITAAAATWGIG